MKPVERALSTGILLSFALCVAWLPQSGASSGAQTGAVGVPAYHTQLPDGPLPATLSPKEFSEPKIQNAYAIAARIKKTLYQQPCYCHCDRSRGHGSLLDCYVSIHAAGCEICMRETFYAYEQLKKDKTAAEIRDGIVGGAWEQTDVSKYQKYPPAPTKK